MTVALPVSEDILPPSPDHLINAFHQLLQPNHNTLDIDDDSSLLFAQLKDLFRASTNARLARKQITAEARDDMDQTHLDLQNLLYERRHLEREIEKCRNFASVHQDVPLHSVEEFATLAPEEARTERVMQDEHQLMLNRLAFELSERQRLDEKRSALVEQRDALLNESRILHSHMESLEPDLEQVKKILSDVHRRANERPDNMVTSRPATPTAPA